MHAPQGENKQMMNFIEIKNVEIPRVDNALAFGILRLWSTIVFMQQ
jgi:hypothetical protein